MALFEIYITKSSIVRDNDPSAWRTRIYQRHARGSTRLEAVKKCLPEIIKNILPEVDDSIKIISIYAGRKGSVTGAANRLMPIRINRKGELI